jgi:calcineurin-like phosphoesterase
MMEMGFDAMSGGNHTWDNKEVYQILENDNRLIRPANFPNPSSSICPGKGYTVVRKGDKALFLINVMGRVFMDAVDCPFLAVDKLLRTLPHMPHNPLPDNPFGLLLSAFKLLISFSKSVRYSLSCSRFVI